ncbi:lymphocyte antigen 6 complex locus protein G6c-like [Rhineura floridana]|uniref:lymphocyte antigen 6 complex locus protein G6c-like n=1 Tax=Rhineura floridana TaxID=261503 RepID=UPI002AC86F30|nr:lymphocyte antigen 6 complex locus protein G6c-like [Rhineura floridana]
MNKYLLLGFSVLAFCTVAQGLMCKVCKFKVGKLCFKSDEPCQAKEDQQCETTKVYTGSLMLFTKHDCNKVPNLCNKTEQRDDVFDMSYNRTCCSQDFCNGGVANIPSLPLFTGLSLAVGWWLAH